VSFSSTSGLCMMWRLASAIQFSRHDETKRVHVEEYAYCVNKLRQNVGLKKWMTSNCDVTNSAHQYKWPPQATEWNSPLKIFCLPHCSWEFLVLFKLSRNHPTGLCFHFLWWFKLAHIYIQVATPTTVANKESIGKFLIENRFHVKLRILRPYSNRMILFD